MKTRRDPAGKPSFLASPKLSRRHSIPERILGIVASCCLQEDKVLYYVAYSTVFKDTGKYVVG